MVLVKLAQITKLLLETFIIDVKDQYVVQDKDLQETELVKTALHSKEHLTTEQSATNQNAANVVVVSLAEKDLLNMQNVCHAVITRLLDQTRRAVFYQLVDQIKSTWKTEHVVIAQDTQDHPETRRSALQIDVTPDRSWTTEATAFTVMNTQGHKTLESVGQTNVRQERRSCLTVHVKIAQITK
jgi:hypothetical protein